MQTRIQVIVGGPLNQYTIRSVEVAEELNRHSTCSVELWSTKDQKMPVESWLGQPIQVQASDEAGESSQIFDGFVVEAVRYHELAGHYSAHLTGITHSYKLDLTHDEKYFQYKGLSDVANEITGEDGLTANVKCAQDIKYNYVQWAGETDFEFIVRLADDHQAWVRPSPTVSSAIDICDQFQSGASVDWSTEGGLLRFGISGRLGQPAFKGTHYDFLKSESTSFHQTKTPVSFGSNAAMVSAVQRGASRAMVPGGLYTDHRAPTASQYQQNLKREAERSLVGGITAHGTSLVPAIRAGNTVNITGDTDSDDNGTYGVTKVIHRYDWRGGYSNEFWGTTWTQWISPKRPQPKPMDGVVVARVIDNNDPHGIGQLTIQYDWLTGGATGWTRMAGLHAGAGRGTMFMPEKGDEVLVAFEHGDPERPIVIGSLWNTANNAPRYGYRQTANTEADLSEFAANQMLGTPASSSSADIAENDVKRIVTKSNNRLQFVDTQGKRGISAAVSQVGSLQILEHCDETGGRSIISITCDNGDIFIGAPNGRVHIQSEYYSREIG